MMEAVEIFWTPAGVTMSASGTRALVDITDGDTPNIRMPVRMLSVDTPEVTARTDARAGAIDQEFAQLAEWIEAGRAPISRALGEFLLPKLATGRAGTLQFKQGKEASAFAKQNVEQRLTRPDGSKRSLFIRMDGHSPFDDNGRLLAYVAPNYSATERGNLSREERSTFNLDMVRKGWAAPFVIYPAVPGELDLPLLLADADAAISAPRGIWTEPDTLLAYEYRGLERLFQITKKIVGGAEVSAADRHSWRERYCVDMRTRVLHGPEDYFTVAPAYRLWLWPRDVQEAVGRLNLVPSRKLAGAA
ncbi:thermonuclease family protein [Actinophytocola sp.]|uniref:thermonuclease family protein n=1 Tax=Actinophytocola sp. TaxID=1872138 RepID=UPI002D7E3F6D|nr:thermonuclease family protein [Actinophytocola sp.]HET9138495.1 thermonuclease family protein [Actinophytocola sp.]